MYKVLFPVFAALSMASAHAQPVIDHLCNPVSGNSFQLFRVDTAGFSPGNAGPDQTWTFNLKVPDTSYARINYFNSDSTPYASGFPSAGLASTIVGSGVYTYYKTNDDSLTILGSAGAASTVVSANPTVRLKYPLYFNQSFSDSAATQTTGYIQTGNLTQTYDAYGTLVLNGRTFDNVVRLHTLEHALNTYATKTVAVQSDGYEWLEAGTSHVLMQITSTSFDAGGDQKGSMKVLNISSYALN